MSGETDTPLFRVDSLTHRALGPLKALTVASSPALRLTPQEAATLSLALAAVRDGRSPEREIFLSPIASDHYFCAHVGPTGIAVETPAGLQSLAWEAVSDLIAQLQAG
jgi:hypothetical protein